MCSHELVMAPAKQIVAIKALFCFKLRGSVGGLTGLHCSAVVFSEDLFRFPPKRTLSGIWRRAESYGTRFPNVNERPTYIKLASKKIVGPNNIVL